PHCDLDPLSSRGYQGWPARRLRRRLAAEGVPAQLWAGPGKVIVAPSDASSAIPPSIPGLPPDISPAKLTRSPARFYTAAPGYPVRATRAAARTRGTLDDESANASLDRSGGAERHSRDRVVRGPSRLEASRHAVGAG